MTKLRALLAGVVIAALAFTGGVWAQTQLTNRTMSGNEVVSMAQGGPGGPSIFAPSSQLRNSQGVLTSALTTGSLVLTTATASLINTAASASVALTLPATPWDGEILEWVNGSAAAFTGATVVTSDGSTIVNGATGVTLTTIPAGGSVEYRYSLTTNSWYKLR